MKARDKYTRKLKHKMTDLVKRYGTGSSYRKRTRAKAARKADVPDYRNTWDCNNSYQLPSRLRGQPMIYSEHLLRMVEAGQASYTRANQMEYGPPYVPREQWHVSFAKVMAAMEAEHHKGCWEGLYFGAYTLRYETAYERLYYTERDRWRTTYAFSYYADKMAELGYDIWSKDAAETFPEHLRNTAA